MFVEDLLLMPTCRSFVLFFLCVAALRSTAQWNVDIIAGGGPGRLNTDLSVAERRGEEEVVDQRMSWALGGMASSPMAGRFYFSTGLLWSMTDGHDEHWIRGYLVTERDLRIHLLHVPVLVGARFGRAHIATGSQWGVVLHSSGTFSTYYSWIGGPDKTSTADDLFLKKIDFGAVVEGGFDLTDRCIVGARYYYGMRDLKDHTDGILSPLSAEQLLLTFRYRILPGRKEASESGGPATAPAE